MTTGGAAKVAEDPEGRAISEAELQEDVQRFTTGFFERLSYVLEPGRLPRAAALQEVLFKRVLLYGANALDIASGKEPAVNLLDMVVFVSLSRESFERYWQPEVLGPAGSDLLEVLSTSEAEIWRASSKALTKPQQAKLKQLIEQWNRDHPHQMRVAATRMPAFSQLVSRDAERNQASGMLAAVMSATQVGDRAVLLGERAMFVAQRMPFLLRLQSRVAATELMAEGASFLVGQEALLGRTEQLLVRTHKLVLQSSELVARTGQLGPVLGDASELVGRLENLTHEAQRLEQAVDALATRFEPLLRTRTGVAGETNTGLEAVIARGDELSQRTLAVLKEARALMPAGAHDERWLIMQDHLDRNVRRWAGYLALLGAVWAVFFWGGYYLVRRHAAPIRRAPHRLHAARARHGHS